VATYAVIGAAREIDGVEVVAVAARDFERGQAYAAQHGIARVHTDYAALLADPDVDLVYAGTPPGVHAEQALAAIAAGKAVLVEKPFALTAVQARMVREAAVAAGVPVFEAMHSVHHKLFARVQDILGGGEIGPLRTLEATFSAPISEADPIRWTPELGGGALMDLGVYPLAWVRRLLGERFTVTEAQAEIRHGVDASFTASLETAGGVVCTVQASMTVEKPVARIVAVGELGRLEVTNFVAPQLGHALALSTAAGERVETVDGPSSFAAQLEAVRRALREGEPFPLPEDDYVRSMEAIERVREKF